MGKQRLTERAEELEAGSAPRGEAGEFAGQLQPAGGKPRWVLIGAVILVVAVSLGGAAVMLGGGGEPKSKASFGEFVSDPSQPIIGDNQVEVALTDSEGRPLAGVKVMIDLRMPDMTHRFGGEAQELREAVYGGTLPFFMEGEWLVKFRVEDPGYSGNRAFPLNILDPTSQFGEE